MLANELAHPTRLEELKEKTREKSGTDDVAALQATLTKIIDQSVT
jgi:hypothetical protein